MCSLKMLVFTVHSFPHILSLTVECSGSTPLPNPGPSLKRYPTVLLQYVLLLAAGYAAASPPILMTKSFDHNFK